MKFRNGLHTVEIVKEGEKYALKHYHDDFDHGTWPRKELPPCLTWEVSDVEEWEIFELFYKFMNELRKRGGEKC